MSDLSVSASFSGTKNSVVISGTGSANVTMSGSVLFANTQSVGFAADEALDLGETPFVPCYIMLKNLDAENYVEVSLGTGGAFAASKFVKLLAGQVALLPPSTGTLYAQAAVAAVELQVLAAAA